MNTVRFPLILTLAALAGAAAPPGALDRDTAPAARLLPSCVTVDWLLETATAEVQATGRDAIWEFAGTTDWRDGVLTITFAGAGPVHYTILDGCAVEPAG